MHTNVNIPKPVLTVVAVLCGAVVALVWLPVDPTARDVLGGVTAAADGAFCVAILSYLYGGAQAASWLRETRITLKAREHALTGLLDGAANVLTDAITELQHGNHEQALSLLDTAVTSGPLSEQAARDALNTEATR